jgi:hypothetical protein
MKIVKSVSLPTAPKAKRKQWQKIVKKHLEKAMQKHYFKP